MFFKPQVKAIRTLIIPQHRQFGGYICCMEAVKTDSRNINSFFRTISNPLKFRLFLARKLPAALFSGVRLVRADADACEVSVPYKWTSRNPFRSTYFACLSMAAEMSTGVLAMAQVLHREQRVSLLVIAVEGKFYKKATGTTTFICKEGALIREAVERSVGEGQPQTARVHSTGYNSDGDVIAEFWITWTFKVKSEAVG